MSLITRRPKMWDIAVISVISVVVTASFILWGLPQIKDYLGAMTTNELIAMVAALVTMAGVTWQIIAFVLKRVAKLKTDLSVEVVSGSTAIITSRIENAGGKKVTPNNVYLFIDEGILEKGGNYEFPFLLKHEGGEYDCVLSKICKREGLSYPQELLVKDFKKIHRDCIQLRNLSSESILYIAPGESFSQDVTIRLPHAGVYRGIFVFTAKDADCICASKQFVIPPNKVGRKRS